MPLLARLLPAPLAVDVRRGAIADLGPLLADRGGRISAAPIGAAVDWVEVDNHADLQRAREIAAHC